MKYPEGLPKYTPVSVFQEETDWLHEQSLKMKNLIVEIGSYEGRSTYALACDTKAVVHAIDPWGSKDYGSVFETFKKNIKSLNNIIPHQMLSMNAVDLFEDKSIEMIFFDGDHSYPGIKSDVSLWLPKCKFLICGHDFNKGHPGVIKAVKEIFPNYKTVSKYLWYAYL